MNVIACFVIQVVGDVLCFNHDYFYHVWRRVCDHSGLFGGCVWHTACGGIHGRLLTAWSTAGVLGPFAITYLRERSLTQEISNLAAKVDPAAFAEKFGTPISQLNELVAAKTVTIAKLMELVPAGTVDPTPSLYNTTMYAMAALLFIALIANLFMRPVNEKHYVDKTHPDMAAAE